MTLFWPIITNTHENKYIHPNFFFWWPWTSHLAIYIWCFILAATSTCTLGGPPTEPYIMPFSSQLTLPHIKSFLVVLPKNTHGQSTKIHRWFAHINSILTTFLSTCSTKTLSLKERISNYCLARELFWLLRFRFYIFDQWGWFMPFCSEDFPGQYKRLCNALSTSLPHSF